MNEIQRFWSKVEKTDGCWLWRGSMFSSGNKKGEAHHANKLTEEAVRYIRTSKLTRKELASLFGVSYEAIANVQRNETWN